jgi:hypothetical protein
VTGVTLTFSWKKRKSKIPNLPTKNELEQLIATTAYTQIAKMYDVSDNAIRKWAKHYGIIE